MEKIKTYATAEQTEVISESKVSSCCGAEDRDAGSGDGPSYSDIGICPDCKDHTDFGYFDDSNDEWHWDNDKKQFYYYQ